MPASRNSRAAWLGWIALLAVAICLAVSLPCAAATPTSQPASQPSAQTRTEHYDLYVEGLDAREVGDMLEQLHARLRDYFGTAPEGRLSVGVYATRDRWAAALEADRQAVPANAGGYYAPYTRKAYLWLQPSAYFSRQLILHEATHQFHWLVATSNRAPTADWYTEGLAEYFGMHNWDGKHLETGVVPAITLEDYPSTALRDYQAAGQDLGRMCVNPRRPEAWALVHFLLDKYPEQFRKLSTRLDRQENAADSWKDSFGSDASKLSLEFGKWLAGHAQPWQIVWVAWQQRGDALECDSKTIAMTIMKETPKMLTVEIEPKTAGGAVGLVFAYRSQTDFHILQVLPGRKAQIIRRQNNAWVAVSTQTLQPATGCDVLSASQDDKATTLWANGQKIATIPAVGQVGLNAEGCRALFRVKSPAPSGLSLSNVPPDGSVQ